MCSVLSVSVCVICWAVLFLPCRKSKETDESNFVFGWFKSNLPSFTFTWGALEHYLGRRSNTRTSSFFFFPSDFHVLRVLSSYCICLLSQQRPVVLNEHRSLRYHALAWGDGLKRCNYRGKRVNREAQHLALLGVKVHLTVWSHGWTRCFPSYSHTDSRDNTTHPWIFFFRSQLTPALLWSLSAMSYVDVSRPSRDNLSKSEAIYHEGIVLVWMSS